MRKVFSTMAIGLAVTGLATSSAIADYKMTRRAATNAVKRRR
jgi:hypothetical protein